MVSTSMLALLDSTTTTLSPLESFSPSDLIQETILPSVMMELRASVKISLIFDRTAMGVWREMPRKEGKGEADRTERAEKVSREREQIRARVPQRGEAHGYHAGLDMKSNAPESIRAVDGL
ncbi:unknown [Fagus crenata]